MDMMWSLRKSSKYLDCSNFVDANSRVGFRYQSGFISMVEMEGCALSFVVCIQS